jgi:hypothetical protein
MQLFRLTPQKLSEVSTLIGNGRNIEKVVLAI